MKKLLLTLCLVNGICTAFSGNPIPDDVRPNPFLYIFGSYYLIDRVYPSSDISPLMDDKLLVCQLLNEDHLSISLENLTDDPMTLMLKDGALLINGTAY